MDLSTIPWDDTAALTGDTVMRWKEELLPHGVLKGQHATEHNPIGDILMSTEECLSRVRDRLQSVP